MRPTSISLKHVQLIKFIGGKHPRPSEYSDFHTLLLCVCVFFVRTNSNTPAIAHLDSSVKEHPMANGLIPGGEGTLKISSLAASRPAPSKPAQSKSSSSSKPYDFVSINELPSRFRNRPMDDAEIDNVNTGGAALLF